MPTKAPETKNVKWYMARLRFGPRLMAVCAHLQISSHLLEHAQIPELRAIVQSASRWPGPLKALPFPSSLPLWAPCSRLAGGLTLCSKWPGNGANRRLRNSPSRQPLNLRPPSASPLLADDNPSSSIKHYFLTGLVRHTCSTLSALAAGRPRGAWVPDSGCLAQCAHRAGSLLKTPKVLGSSP